MSAILNFKLTTNFYFFQQFIDIQDMSKTLHLKYPEYSRQKYKAFLEICEAGFNHLQKSAAAGQPQAPKQPKAINVSDSRWWFRVVPKYPINLFIDTAQFSVSANSPAIFAKPVPIWTLKLLNIGPVLFLDWRMLGNSWCCFHGFCYFSNWCFSVRKGQRCRFCHPPLWNFVVLVSARVDSLLLN